MFGRMTITVGEAAEMLGRLPDVGISRRGQSGTARERRRYGGRVVSLRDPRVVQAPLSAIAFNRNIWLTGLMATRIRLDASPNVAADLADDLRAASTVEQAVTIAVGDHSYQLSPDLIELLFDLVDDVAEGRDVTVAPAGLPVGTELASELLGVSRPWLTTLLDRGDIPSTRVGSKRRVRLGDLLAYRRADDARRRQGLTWEFLDEES